MPDNCVICDNLSSWYDKNGRFRSRSMTSFMGFKCCFDGKCYDQLHFLINGKFNKEKIEIENISDLIIQLVEKHISPLKDKRDKVKDKLRKKIIKFVSVATDEGGVDGS